MDIKRWALQKSAELGVPYSLSTASSSSIEDVAKAKENGFTVLVFSLYTWTLD